MNRTTMRDYDKDGNELIMVHDIYGLKRKTAYMVTQRDKSTGSTAEVYWYPIDGPTTKLASIPNGYAALVQKEAHNAILEHCRG